MRTDFYEKVRNLSVTISSFSLVPAVQEVADGFKRSTTLVTLAGLGSIGSGEELTFQKQDQDNLLRLRGEELPIIGTHTIDSLSDAVKKSLSHLPEPEQKDSSQYRSWAFESAALDLAVRQHRTSLSSLLGLPSKPVNFVVSLRLDKDLSTDRLQSLLTHHPDLEFKLDVTSDWTADFMLRLAATTRIAVLDFKAFYHGTRVDQAPESTFYEMATKTFSNTIFEDLDIRFIARTARPEILRKLSYDEPIRSASDIRRLSARRVNIKPARIGSLRYLLGLYGYCLDNGIEMYGGGLFEIGIGRKQIQYLASLFHPRGTNDVAPVEYNFATADFATLPRSPLRDIRAFGCDT
ncbi:MAG: hypothetical protein QOH70_2103 [Blastocatellia bacterium]|jgi:hypothetical protein|nr:hypothetical protein [Blastocatellia bacterium]